MISSVIEILKHGFRHHVWRRDCREVRGDGYHDDTTGIQAWIDEAGSVHFPPGVYVVTDTIYIHKDGSMHLETALTG